MFAEETMFHLSLPVTNFAACIDFYERCFDAKTTMLGSRIATLHVFDGQLTFHDEPDSPLGAAERSAMHFGHVVSEAEWFAIEKRVLSIGTPIASVAPDPAQARRGKLLIFDPSQNIVEINSRPGDGV